VALSIVVVLAIYLGDLAWRGLFTQGPNGYTMAVDVSISLAGADVLSHHENPYDRALLFAAERRSLIHSRVPRWGIPSTTDPYESSSRRVGNPPLYFAALEPLADTDFRITGTAMVILLYLLLGLGMWCILRVLEWRGRLLPIAIFMAMPPALLAAFYGNSNVYVFVSLALGMALIRSRPLIAGVVLSLCWVKLTLGLPFVLLIVLFQARDPRRVAIGFFAATAAQVLLTLAFVGPEPLVWWARSLVSYPADLAAQGDLATISGAYGPLLPTFAHAPLEAAMLLLALGATAAAWLRYPRVRPLPLRPLAWLWVLWFLCLPFAHYHDEIVLAAPIVAILGVDACYLAPRLRQLLPGGPIPPYPRAPFFAVYAAFLTGLLLLPLPVSLLPMPVVALLLCCWRSVKAPRWPPTAETQLLLVQLPRQDLMPGTQTAR
jgi:hypothetical protein